MQGNKQVLPYHIGGTLAANQTIVIQLPFAFTLIEVRASASNDSDATLEVGTAADPNAYLTSAVIGDSGAFVAFDRADWDGVSYPATGGTADVDYIHIAADTSLVLALDFDGSAGTAAQNVEILVTIAEG